MVTVIGLKARLTAVLLALLVSACEPNSAPEADSAASNADSTFSVVKLETLGRLSEPQLRQSAAATARGERPPRVDLPPLDPTLPDDPIEGWPPKGGGSWAAHECRKGQGQTNGQCPPNANTSCSAGKCALSCVVGYDEATQQCTHYAVCGPCPGDGPSPAPTTEPTDAPSPTPTPLP